MKNSNPGKDYRAIRLLLLTQSLTVSLVVEQVRKFLGIPENGYQIEEVKSEQAKKLLPKDNPFHHKGLDAVMYQSENHSEFVEKIGEKNLKLLDVVADALFIDTDKFCQYVMYNLIPATPTTNLRMIVSREDILNEPGIYVKIDPFTSGDELLAAFKHVEKVRDGYYEVIHGMKSRKKSVGQDPKKDIEAYTRIESKIKEYFREKKQFTTSDTEDSYQSVIGNAINELSGEAIKEGISEEKWQEELEKQAKQITTVYYDIVDRYNIPTLRELPRFLRLIPNK